MGLFWEFVFMRDKFLSFKEDGQVELHTEQEVEIFERLCREEGIAIEVTYGACPLGEYWTVKRK